jgi:hypothetical protein
LRAPGPPLIAAALLAFGVHAGARALAAPEPLLARLDALVVPLADLAGAWVEGDGAGPWVGGALGAALCLWLAWLWRRREHAPSAPLAAACALAWLGELLLLAGRAVAGAVCFGAALALVAWRWRPLTLAPEPPPSRAVETAAWLALCAAFLALGLYRIDVQPAPSVDESAYFEAARMQRGERPRGAVLRMSREAVVYDFARFAAQPLPLRAQSAALGLWGSRLGSARLASLLLSGAALLGFAALVRSRWGPRAALLTLGAGAASPLWLAYAQRGYYVAASELHAVVCFALLLRLERLRTLAAAGLLGAALGVSIYLYQLSWFVAPLCALCLLAAPSAWRVRGTPALAALAAAAALCVALPGAWWHREGLREVRAQSVDKLVPSVRALAEPDASRALGSALARRSSRAELDAAAERYRAQGLYAEPTAFGRHSGVLLLAGEREPVVAALAELGAQGWRDTRLSLDDSLLLRARQMAAQLFAGPAPEQLGFWVTGPVLDPVIAPLVLVGVAAAWRRRQDPLARCLAIWTGAAWLLPALVAGALPRRAVLALPFGLALAARVWLEVSEHARLAWLARVALVVLALAAGTGLYFGTWVQDESHREPAPTRLELEDVVRGLPDEPVLFVTRLVPELAARKRELAQQGLAAPRLERAPGVPVAAQIRRISCRREPPFAWLTLDTPEQRMAFGALAADHTLEWIEQRGVLALRVRARAPEACAQPARERPQP